MRYGLLVLIICLGLVFDLGLYIASCDDSTASFDLLRPSTLLPIIATRFRDLYARGRDLLTGLVDEFRAPFHERTHRTLPAEAFPQ